MVEITMLVLMFVSLGLSVVFKKSVKCDVIRDAVGQQEVIPNDEAKADGAQ